MSEAKVKKNNLVVEYLQDSLQELKRVTWPTRNQAVRLTLLVLGFCFAAAIVIGAMDALFSYGHLKLVDYASTINPPAYTDTTGLTDTTGAGSQPVTGSAQPINVTTTQPGVSVGGVKTVAPAATATATTTPAATTPTSTPAAASATVNTTTKK